MRNEKSVSRRDRILVEKAGPSHTRVPLGTQYGVPNGTQGLEEHPVSTKILSLRNTICS